MIATPRLRRILTKLRRQFAINRVDPFNPGRYDMVMDVRDPIHGNIGLSTAEVAVLDSAAYQRLRAIKQLGFSELSFPGATHNRYLHSLGVCHLSGVAFDSIFTAARETPVPQRSRLRC